MATEKGEAPEVLAIDIPEAGRMAGMSMQRAYAAARSGHMPTIRIGAKRMVVPLARWRKILNGETAA